MQCTYVHNLNMQEIQSHYISFSFILYSIYSILSNKERDYNYLLNQDLYIFDITVKSSI